MSLDPHRLTPGMRVRYCGPGCVGEPATGTVSSWNASGVFVKFDAQLQRFGWAGTTAQLCRAADLVEIDHVENDGVIAIVLAPRA